MNKGVKKLVFNDYDCLHQGQDFSSSIVVKNSYLLCMEKKKKTTEEDSIKQSKSYFF